MGLFQKLAGFINPFVQIGGPQGNALKNNGVAVEHRNAGDSAFANARGADPLVAQDFVTLNYFNANVPPGVTQSIEMTIGTAATDTSTASIPANVVVESVMVDVTTAYSSGATISVGQTGNASLLMATTDNFPQTVGQYYIPLDTGWGASALPVLVTVGGTPSAGAAKIKVEYQVPLS